jgi:hypothetical protein
MTRKKKTMKFNTKLNKVVVPSEPTPIDGIRDLNETFTDWKTTEQVQYDKDGRRIDYND